jgi:hypothetical protein
MSQDDVLVVAGRCLIDCATLRELKEALRELRTNTHSSVLADFGEERISAIEILREGLGLELCAC